MIFRSETHSTEVREAMRGGNKSVKLTKLSDVLPENARLFSMLTLEPGASIGYHVHENESELFYFLSGAGRVKDDEEWIDIAAGDTMLTASGHGHCVENTGAETLNILAAIIKD